MTTGAWAAAVTAMKMAGENGVEVTARATVMTETAMEGRAKVVANKEMMAGETMAKVNAMARAMAEAMATATTGMRSMSPVMVRAHLEQMQEQSYKQREAVEMVATRWHRRRWY